MDNILYNDYENDYDNITCTICLENIELDNIISSGCKNCKNDNLFLT